MAVTINAEFDDAKVIAAFNRISLSGKNAAKSIDEGFGQSNKALQLTTGAINMINPQFAQYAQLIGKGGLAWASVAATVGAAARAINEVTKSSKEGVTKDSWLGQLLDASDDPSAGWFERTGGKFLAWLRGSNDGIEDLRNEWREVDRVRKMTMATEESAKNLDEVRKSIAMSAAQEQSQQAADRMQSIGEINAALEAEDALISRLAAQGKLSDERAQESAAKQNALLAKRRELESTYIAMQVNLGAQAAQGQIDNLLAQERSITQLEHMYAAAATEAGNLAKAGRLSANEAARLERIQSGALAKQQEISARQQQVGRNQAATDRAMAFEREMEAAETIVKLKSQEASLEKEMISLRTSKEATLADIEETESRILATKQKIAETEKNQRELQKDLDQEKVNIARKREVDSAVSLRQVKSLILRDALQIEQLNSSGLGTDRQRNALQQEMLGLLQKEAELRQKNLDATVDELKKRFAIFAAKDKDRVADVAAKAANGDCNCGPGGAATSGADGSIGGVPQGWQQWGGPVHMPQLQDFRGQGIRRGLGELPAAAGGSNTDGGGADFFGELFGAGVNRRERMNLKKSVRKLAKEKLEQQLSDIDDDFAIAIDDAAGDPDAIHRANKQKGAKRKRAIDDFRSGRTSEAAQNDLLGDAANNAADAMAENLGLTKEQTAALKKLANEAVAAKQERDDIRNQLNDVKSILDGLGGGNWRNRGARR